ncbi:Zn-dependent hydrolase [Advenella kashmirensis W13003]|uniref:Zn-dependent hydrolase n=1 Tax=Advenella kashmirensis W13003 TaxID=1424334 RepID=V8QU43_9BURK|nr:MBL fold metallo-hydrolase [Advenella kashmirensis]ETF02840.1 Zn-dependent hydrolase [Advenella kashmirensis W13003]
MNELEARLNYPFGDVLPEPAQTQEVAPGVKWIRMPLPFALDHINLWLLKDEIDGREGWTVVDTGIAKPEVKALWERVFEEALDGLPVLRLIVTHMHPDHTGLAAWMCERWQVPLYMSMTDFYVASLWSSRPAGGAGTGGEVAVAHFARHGLNDPQAQEQIRERANYYPSLVDGMPRRFSRMLGGERLLIGGRQWDLIAGYGHAPEHISLYCPEIKVLISGDMVLPRISTNVSVFDHEPDADPLKLYLQSLDSYEPLEQDTLVLPSHGKPFKGLHERLRQQRDHHAERLAEVLQWCGEKPMSTTDVVPLMFKRKLDLHQLTFAMGEALAHLQMLYHEGKLTCKEDDKGVLRYSAA